MFEIKYDGYLYDCALSKDGLFLALASTKNSVKFTVTVWNLEKGNKVVSFSMDAKKGIEFGPKGKYIYYTDFHSFTLFRTEISTGKKETILDFKGTTINRINSYRISKSGRYLIYRDDKGSHVYDLSLGRLTKVTGIAGVDYDGKRIMDSKENHLVVRAYVPQTQYKWVKNVIVLNVKTGLQVKSFHARDFTISPKDDHFFVEKILRSCILQP